MTPVQITERTLVGFYDQFIELELQQLSDTEIRCCEAVATGCDT